ncbi:MAG: hypothetical protein K6U04_09190, partial [Armatimonadetes bacterium]|nr:hypothetical protein [Armatimonadota bacterium]
GRDAQKNKEILRYMEFFNRTNVLSVNSNKNIFFNDPERILASVREAVSKWFRRKRKATRRCLA